jgi:predicted transport protein
MIKIEDLRIGNIFNRIHGKGTSGCIVDVEIIKKILDTEEYFALNNLIEVKLTKDFTEFFGFKQDGNFMCITLKDGEKKHEIDIEFNDKMHINYTTNDGMATLVGNWSVNQFQSLVYSLTNINLDFNPK